MKKSTSIKRKLLVAMLIIIIIQSVIYLIGSVGSGSINNERINSYNNVDSITFSRSTALETQLVHYKGLLDEKYSGINNSIINAASTNNIDLTSSLNNEQSEKVLSESCDKIIGMLNDNEVNGGFIILNNEGNDKQGVYLRDINLDASSSDNGDILAEFGLPGLLKARNITMDSMWSSTYNLDEATNTDFYQLISDNANNYSIDKIQSLGYYSKLFKLRENDVDIFTYTLPLYTNEGKFYGVLGIELQSKLVTSLLDYHDLNASESAGFILATSDNNKDFKVSFVKTSYAKTLLKEDDDFQIKSGEISRITTINDQKTQNLLVSAKSLKLNSNHNPYGDNAIYLVSIVDETVLFKNMKQLESSIFISFLIALVCTIVLIIIISNHISYSLNKVTNALKNSDPDSPIKLMEVGIKEVDALSHTIEQLSEDVAYSSSRMERLFEDSQLSIAFIELDHNKKSAYCSNNVSKILDIANVDLDDYDEVIKLIDKLVSEMVLSSISDNEKIYKYRNKWIKTNRATILERDLYTISDITNEEDEKIKIAYERDYDGLTGLLNRNAFNSKASKIVEENKSVIACVLFDLDNLKYVNDVYGHEFGDQYIRRAAESFKSLSKDHVLVARRSGDEFLFLIYGYETIEELNTVAATFFNNLSENRIIVPGGNTLKIRGSAGISWLNKDAFNFDDLVKHADFAMYDAKRSQKGSLISFDQEVYDKDNILINDVELLNELFEKMDVKYAFQPIVDLKSGKVFAFEGLMRPQNEKLSSPGDVMRLAKSQSKLYYIEQMTWYKALADFTSQVEDSKKYRLFINSIPNITLSKVDMVYLEENYNDYLDRICVEILEGEQIIEKSYAYKMEYIKKWNASIAIDDYGSGYSNEENLINILPQFIKIDISLIHNIMNNDDKIHLVSNIVTFAKSKKIKVIAEGIETIEELRCCQELKIDYGQGFYLKKPSFKVEELDEDKRNEIINMK